MCPTRKLTGVSKNIFCRVGVPDNIWTDGGPQFTSSSFRVPTEAAVKLLRRCWDERSGQLDDERWIRGVLQHRNTPGRSGRSPVQIVFGRPIRDNIPAHRRSFALEWQRAVDIAEAQATRNQKTEDVYNQNAREMSILSVGNHVSVQDHRTGRWDQYGVITEVGPYRRYYVRLAGGRILVRNRRHLRRRYGYATPDPAAAEQRGATTSDVLHLLPSARTAAAADVNRRTSRESGPGGGAPPPLRRSERLKRPPRRLIEEI